MLEQSALHGRIFCSMAAGKTLASKPVKVTEISFGPMRPVMIYRISDSQMWVQDQNKKAWYHYIGKGGGPLMLAGTYPETEIQIKEHTKKAGTFYYYGKALYNAKNKGGEHSYFIKNVPNVSYKGIPDISSMEMPLTMQALNYEQVFSYPDKLRQLLKGIPACYADRYKRPIKRVHGHTYPIPMEQATQTAETLKDASYPMVVQFAGTGFAVADLEPVHTEEDLIFFNSLPGYYEEDTPRGGKHKLICIKQAQFKLKYSEGLEIISGTQATLYGINAKWLSDSPLPFDGSGCVPVGHTHHKITARLERPDTEKEVRMLEEKARQNMSVAKLVAESLYKQDPDDSHAEYVALHTLYMQDIKPYAAQFTREKLPWILEAYAGNVISHRQKHETLRQGLPYLVYLSDIVINKKELVHIWTGNQNSTSFVQEN